MKVGSIVQHKKRNEIQGTITRMCRKKFELDDTGKCSWLKVNFKEVQAISRFQRGSIPKQRRTKPNKPTPRSGFGRLYSCKFMNKHMSNSPTEVWTLHDQKKIYYCKIHIENHVFTQGVEYEADVYEYLEKELKGSVYAEYNFIPLLCVLRKQTFDNLLELANSSRPEKSNTRTQISKASCPQENQTVSDIQLARALLASVGTEKSPLIATGHVVEGRNQNLVITAKNYTYTALITECIGSKPVSLYDFYKENKNQTSMLVCLLSRLVLSMHRLHQLGVSHNDIHWYNVLVHEHDKVDLEYSLEGKRLQYKKISMSPVLFDWDWAQMKDGRCNPYLKSKQLDRPFSPGRDFSIFFEHWYGLPTKRMYKTVTRNIYKQYQTLMKYTEVDLEIQKKIEKLHGLLLVEHLEQEEWAKEFDKEIDHSKFVLATVYTMKSYCAREQEEAPSKHNAFIY